LVGRSLSHPAAISRFSFEETRARVGRFRDDEGWLVRHQNERGARITSGKRRRGKLLV
jgi:hypothetical protein